VCTYKLISNLPTEAERACIVLFEVPEDYIPLPNPASLLISNLSLVSGRHVSWHFSVNCFLTSPQHRGHDLHLQSCICSGIMSWNASIPPSLPVSSSGIHAKSYKGPVPPIDLDTLPQTFEQLDEAIASYTVTDRTPRVRRLKLNELSLAVRGHTKQHILNAWNESMESPDYTFTPFPNLPTEIRFRVWEYALSTPRIVELGKVRQTSSPATQFQYKHKPVPPLLHTNSESRVVSQQVYRSFASPAELSELDCGNWIRFGYDIIHLRDFDFREDVGGYAIEGVGRAVAGNAEWRGIGRFGDR
jgi:hypothetical protein